MTTMNASRRLFLRHAGVMSALGAAGGPLALNLSAIGTASAQAASDYKAIVCIFLFGGNDSVNMVLPTDTASFANYTTLRNQALIALGVAILAQLLYLAFRFNRAFGISAVVAMVHDVVIVLGVFAWLGKPIDGVFLAALLTIIGLSVIP